MLRTVTQLESMLPNGAIRQVHLGGPIKKDKLFFFSNYEIVKRNFPGMNRIINSDFAPTAS